LTHMHRLTMNAEAQNREHLFASYCEMSSKESSGLDDLTEKNVSCDGLGKLLLTSICCKFISLVTLNEENNCLRYVEFCPCKRFIKLKAMT